MAPRGIGRQLVLQRPIQNGRMALSGTLKILFESARGDLREGRTERLTVFLELERVTHDDDS